MAWIISILAMIAAVVAGFHGVSAGSRRAETIGILVGVAAVVVIWFQLFHSAGVVIW